MAWWRRRAAVQVVLLQDFLRGLVLRIEIAVVSRWEVVVWRALARVGPRVGIRAPLPPCTERQRSIMGTATTLGVEIDSQYTPPNHLRAVSSHQTARKNAS